MPVVPTYDSLQVGQTSRPDARVSPNLFADNQAQQIGRGLQQFGGETARTALDMQQQANSERVEDATNQAVKALTDMKVEAFNLKGRDALERPDGKPLPDEYAEKFGKTVGGIEASLGADVQRKAFRQRAAQMQGQFYAQLSAHMVEQGKAYRKERQQATIETATYQGATLWGDPLAVKQSAEAITFTVEEILKEAGLHGDDKVRQAELVKALTPLHAGVLQGMVDGDRLDLARKYYDENSASMSLQTRANAMKVIEAGDFEKRTQEKADELYAKHDGDTAAALKEVRETLSGKDEDAVVTRIKTLDAERVTLRERAQKDAADQAWRIYSQSGGLGKIPASVLAGMDGRDLEALRRTARADAEARAAKSEVKTDPSVYYALTIAQAQDSGNFAREDLRRYFDKLSPSDRKHFIDLQGKTLKPGEGEQITTAAQQKAATVKALGLKDKDAGVFMQQADRALLAAQQEKGGPLNQSERQKVLDGLALEGRVPGDYFGTNSARAFEAQAQGKPFTPVWTDAQIRKATAALQGKGVKNPSKQQIEATLRAVYGTQ